MIPKIIHQIWIGDNSIPKDLESFCLEIRTVHYHWEYKFWTNENCGELVSELTEKGKSFFYSMLDAKKWALACDLLRMAAVHKYGGLYLDCDFKMAYGQNFNSLPLENDLLLSNSRMPNENNLVRLQNCIFAAKPEHEFIKTLIDNIRNVPYTLTNGFFEPSEIYGCQYFTTEYFLRMYPNDIIGLPKHCFSLQTKSLKNKEIILTSDLFYGKDPKICKHLYRLSHCDKNKR